MATCELGSAKDGYGGTATIVNPDRCGCRIMYGNTATAQRCPVCNGAGRVSVTEYPRTARDSIIPTTSMVKCHGCQGSGWVTVRR